MYKIKLSSSIYFCLLFLSTITMRAQENTANDAAGIISDRKISVNSVEASNMQTGEEAGKSIDGNISTLYHSNWNETVFPVTLTYHFKDVETMDYLVYYPRLGKKSCDICRVGKWRKNQSKKYRTKINNKLDLMIEL